MSYDDPGASSANDRRAGEDVPDELDSEWPEWKVTAWTIATYELRSRAVQLAREGTSADLVHFVARWGYINARKGFDPDRGPFKPRLRTKIRREIQALVHLCRHDRRSEATDDLSAQADTTDAIAAWERQADVARAMRMALEAIPLADQTVFIAVLQVIDQPGRRHLADAAKLLERSVDDVTRAWERILDHVRRAYPRGLASLGL